MPEDVNEDNADTETHQESSPDEWSIREAEISDSVSMVARSPERRMIDQWPSHRGNGHAGI
jgi:hypothetical protein